MLRTRVPLSTRPRAAIAALCGLLVFGFAAVPAASAEAGSGSPDASRAQRLVDKWARSRSLRGVRVGVAVTVANTGEELAAIDGDTLYNPASGTKLLTTAAALMTLPLDTTWSTRVCGHLEEGTVRGPLILHGGGDPKLELADVVGLARDLAKAGVARVPDGIVVDASHFDAETLPPAFDQKNPDAGYRASIGAGASNFGAVRVTAKPGRRAGARVDLVVEGRSEGLVVDNRATTVAGEIDALEVRATALDLGRTKITVSGTLGLAAETWWERRRLDDPDAFTGYLLRKGLHDAGVEVGGTVTVERTRPTEPPPPLLAERESAGLAQTIDDINTWSNNFMAETLLKQLGVGPDGAAATWKRAVRVATDALIGLGLSSDGFRIVNGSGLYRATHVSPRMMTKLLSLMAADPVRGPPFQDSLAVAGQPGTLASRLRGRRTAGKVIGKTGTLDEVVSLSGYVPNKRLGRLAFAVFVNEATPERTAALRAAIDRLVVKLARL